MFILAGFVYFLAAFVAAIIVCIIGSIVIRWIKENAAMLTACFIAVALLLAAMVFLPPAHAEENVVVVEIDDYIVSPVVLGREIILEISFQYEGEMIAFYWDGELDTSYPIWVEIWCPGLECLDAGYIE